MTYSSSPALAGRGSANERRACQPATSRKPRTMTNRLRSCHHDRKLLWFTDCASPQSQWNVIVVLAGSAHVRSFHRRYHGGSASRNTSVLPSTIPHGNGRLRTAESSPYHRFIARDRCRDCGERTTIIRQEVPHDRRWFCLARVVRRLHRLRHPDVRLGSRSRLFIAWVK